MKIALKMTGCKNNRYELDQVLLWAAKNNVEIADETKADFCVINTCTVTHTADKKSRQLIRKTKHQNPNLKTIVFGCAARMQEKNFKQIKEIDYLVPDLMSVLQLLEEQIDVCPEILRSALDGNETNSPQRSRALVQIQDGCENYCSYCIIAAARGRSKNRPVNDIIDEILRHEKTGFNEVVLTGINIGAYGCSITTKPDESKLADLLQTILDETKIQRIRLSSMGPEYFNGSGRRSASPTIEILKNPRICRHIHLSVQSGSDTVLKRMRRNYTTTQMDEIIQKLQKEIPGIAITADVIVGFPEETDTEFQETLDFVKRNQLAKVHVFPYSIRRGTLAEKMEPLPDDVKKKRAKKLQAIADKLRKEFIKKQIDTKTSVLWETPHEGLSDNYLRVYQKNPSAVRSVSSINITKKNVFPD